MKKLAVSLLCVLLLGTSLSYAFVVHCPDSPDGKHHMLRAARNTNVQIRDSDGDVLRTVASIPEECKYCGEYIFNFIEEDTMCYERDMHVTRFGTYWVYSSDVQDMDYDVFDYRH